MTDEANHTDDGDENQAELVADLEAFATEPPPVTRAIQFPDIPPKDYDTEKLETFLDAVFHAGLDDDENILTWMVKPNSQPYHPKSEGRLMELLKATRQPKALYYATATCKLCPKDHKLHHRKDLFCSLRVVVLDDIGTKVDTSKIPADFPPSYIIESSEGNFQYGYILDEPVEDLAAAEALIQLVYESGYSDEGGKTPVKLVRMPEGVNGKKGEKGKFISGLVSLTDITYSPQEIFDHLKLNVSWEEVLLDADDVTKRRASKSLGSTPWAEVTPQAQAMNGYIDPVLEYLYDTDQVALDNQGTWIDIKCPWAEGHTTGKSTARYSPLGRGESVDTRGFKCFHDNCAATNTVEFLKYIATNSGIQAGVHDPAAQLTTRYVFDKIQNAAWDIKSDKRDIRIAMNSFTNLHPHKTTIQTVDGKEKLVGMATLWATAPSRVVVAGATYDPSTTARIVTSQGENYVNLFSIPAWGHGPIDPEHVKKFEDFLEYLVPDAGDREYFTTWLAAKCQDMSFRGAGIVMVANKQGVGRSTLADMIRTLIGPPNVADVPLTEIVGGSQFNEWQEKPFIITEETLSANPDNFYNHYEKIKTLVDTTPKMVTINPKFGLKREVKTYGSYLFLSNHANAIAVAEGDRRLYVMNNAPRPETPAYFTTLHKWIGALDDDGLPTWGRHIFRWLQTLPVDIEFMTAPPPKTQAKIDMAGAALSTIDFAVLKLLECWPGPYINAAEVYQIFSHPLLAGPLRFDEDTNKKFVKNAVNAASTTYGFTVTDSSLNKTVRPRVLIEKEEGAVKVPGNKTGVAKSKALLTRVYAKRVLDHAALAEKVVAALHEDDRI